jgi:hypothetical protein
MLKHQGYIRRREWSKSGIAAHKENGSGKTDFPNPEILATVQGKSKQQMKKLLNIQESMMIRLHRTGPYQGGFNDCKGNCFSSRQWDPLYYRIREANLKETSEK